MRKVECKMQHWILAGMERHSDLLNAQEKSNIQGLTAFSFASNNIGWESSTKSLSQSQ